MYCPQCGQQQASGIVRFCSRCGFALDGVIQLLASGGILPVYHQSDEPVTMSPRRKGVKQGAILLLSGAVIVPILGVLASFSNAAFPQILAALAAIICFIGGPFRMLYAALFEEGAPPRYPTYGPSPPVIAPQQFSPPRQHTALPPQPARGPSAWRKPNTAELVNQPSVTENTTRLLDKEDRTER
jgi:hypothetical protein